jgi:hypothetical protein
VNCLFCGKALQPISNKVKQVKFCSKECWWKFNGIGKGYHHKQSEGKISRVKELEGNWWSA